MIWLHALSPLWYMYCKFYVLLWLHAKLVFFHFFLFHHIPLFSYLLWLAVSRMNTAHFITVYSLDYWVPSHTSLTTHAYTHTHSRCWCLNPPPLLPLPLLLRRPYWTSSQSTSSSPSTASWCHSPPLGSSWPRASLIPYSHSATRRWAWGSSVARSLVLAGHLLYAGCLCALRMSSCDMSGTNLHGALAGHMPGQAPPFATPLVWGYNITDLRNLAPCSYT